MDMPTTCPCTSQHNGLPHWKCVLSCCDKCPGISVPHQETNTNATNTCSTIRFHVYRHVSCCTVHDIRSYEERTKYYMFSTDFITVTPGKVYAWKELVLLETLISEFHSKYYIPKNQKLAFNFPHVHILGTHHCGKKRREAFKRLIK